MSNEWKQLVRCNSNTLNYPARINESRFLAARSPVFAHTSSTIEGLATIRAFRAEKQMLAEFDCRQDKNSSASFMFGAIARGFAFWLDFMCALYITMVVFSFLVLGQGKVMFVFFLNIAVVGIEV